MDIKEQRLEYFLNELGIDQYKRLNDKEQAKFRKFYFDNPDQLEKLLYQVSPDLYIHESEKPGSTMEMVKEFSNYSTTYWLKKNVSWGMVLGILTVLFLIIFATINRKKRKDQNIEKPDDCILNMSRMKLNNLMEYLKMTDIIKMGKILIFLGLFIPCVVYPFTSLIDENILIAAVLAQSGVSYEPNFKDLEVVIISGDYIKEKRTYNGRYAIPYKYIFTLGLIMVFSGGGLMIFGKKT